MKKILYLIAVIFLAACGQKEINEPKEEKILAPLEITKNDYDSFFLKGKKYLLPLSYDDFANNGIKLNEDEFYYPQINKNSQAMANLKADEVDLGATFKNDKSHAMDIKKSKIIELYINNNGKNKDFSISGLAWGDSYQKAKKTLKNLHIEEASKDSERTLNYNTDNNYVSLYFKDNKLCSAAIFSKSYMRDESYINGEFVVFGQTLKFPFTINDLESMLATNININRDYQKLDPKDKLTIKIYSPLFDSSEIKLVASGLDFELKNTSDKPVDIKDAQVISVRSDNSSDISIGNIYVGASIDELKIVDKKNQNPNRLNIEGKVNDHLTKFIFNADNDTDYIYYADDEMVKHIEIINTKEQ